MKYAVCQLELCSTTSRYHLQGYVELSKPMRVQAVKTLFGWSSMHLETRRGTRDQARDYSMKTDTRCCGPWEFGLWSTKSQGRRSDLETLAESIKTDGLTLKDVMQESPLLYCQYRNGISDLVARSQLDANKKWRELDVWVLWGDSGTGKSRAAFEMGDYFLLDQSSDGNSVWFDGYDGEKTLIIDDFYGWIRYSFFLRLLDGHPCRLPIKGSHTYAAWTTVIITSNTSPERWYKWDDLKISAALQRRITNMTHFTWDGEPGGLVNTDPYEWNRFIE